MLSASPFARHVGIVLCELYYFGCEVQCVIEPGWDLLVDSIIDEADSAASRVDNQDRKKEQFGLVKSGFQRTPTLSTLHCIITGPTGKIYVNM